MRYNTDGEWVVDLGKMTCENNVNRIVIKFDKEGETLIGQIMEMPFELVKKLAKEIAVKTDGHKPVKEAILEAEELFLHAYFEYMIESGKKIKFEEKRNKEKKAVVRYNVAAPLHAIYDYVLALRERLTW